MPKRELLVLLPSKTRIQGDWCVVELPLAYRDLGTSGIGENYLGNRRKHRKSAAGAQSKLLTPDMTESLQWEPVHSFAP